MSGSSPFDFPAFKRARAERQTVASVFKRQHTEPVTPDTTLENAVKGPSPEELATRATQVRRDLARDSFVRARLGVKGRG